MTAEFAMVLPVVVMVLGITLGSLSLQIERVKLVTAAAEISRGLGRGEPADKLAWLSTGRELVVTEHDNYVCVSLSGKFGLLGLAGFNLTVSDQECARKLGL